MISPTLFDVTPYTAVANTGIRFISYSVNIKSSFSGSKYHNMKEYWGYRYRVKQIILLHPGHLNPDKGTPLSIKMETVLLQLYQIPYKSYKSALL
jgi:hypothetical protein